MSTENQQKIGLIGSDGAMGQMLMPFLSSLTTDNILTANVNSSPEELKTALLADIVVLACPREALHQLLELANGFSAQQLIVDIFSIKRGCGKLITQAGASHISLHPMNGPNIPWSKQKWLTIGNIPSRPSGGAKIISHLEKRGVLLLKVKDEQEHDHLMTLVLSIPEINSLVITELLSSLAKSQHISLMNIIQAASPAFAKYLSASIYTNWSTVRWLREEILNRMQAEERVEIASIFKSLAKSIEHSNYNLELDRQESLIAQLNIKDEMLLSIRRSAADTFEQWNSNFRNNFVIGDEELHFQKKLDLLPLLQAAQITNRPLRLGIHGIKGSFSEEAILRYVSFESNQQDLVQYQMSYEYVELIESEQVLVAVSEKRIDAGIVAFANSGSGGYLATITAMGKHNFFVLGLFRMPLRMCLLAHKDITDVQQITELFGHPVAVAQCRATINRLFPEHKLTAAEDSMDTALSAKLLAAGELPKTTAIFASARAAELYGLRLLAQGVNDDPNNATAFAVITHPDNAELYNYRTSEK